jgi:hypothetical protein
VRHDLAKLRSEAVAYLAHKYPAIRLIDIGLAMGWSQGAALSMASDAMRLHGGSRPRGGKSPAYRPNNLRKYDYVLILKEIKAHPELRYRDIGALCGCPMDTVIYVAHLNGIFRGFRRK